MCCFCFEDTVLNVYIENQKKGDVQTTACGRHMRATLRVRWKFEPKEKLGLSDCELQKLGEGSLSRCECIFVQQKIIFEFISETYQLRAGRACAFPKARGLSS